MSSTAVKLEKKLIKIFGEEKASSLRSLDKKELEFKLIQLSKHRSDIETTKEMDLDLADAKEHLKQLDAPYKEQMTGNVVQSRFIVQLLKEMGE